MSAVGLRVGVWVGVGAVEPPRLGVKPLDTPREHEDDTGRNCCQRTSVVLRVL